MTIHRPLFSPFRPIRAVLAIATPLGICATIFGQSVIMSLPQEPVNAPVIRDAVSASAGTDNSRPPSSSVIFARGPVSLRANILYRHMNAEGLPIGTRRVSSTIQTIAPTISIDLGSHWSVAYNASWSNYSEDGLEDTFDNSLSIHGGMIGQHWVLTLSQGFSLATPTLFETGRQTEQSSWNTNVSASRSIGSRYSVQLNGNASGLQTEFGNDSREWSTDDWFLVQISPSLTAGIGPTFGWVDIVDGIDSTYQRFMGRLSFAPTYKLNFTASGGVERRQAESALARDIENPILNVAGTYRPFETTSIGLSFGHSVSTSLYDNQVTVGANWRVTLQQRLLGRVFLNASWSRAETEYESTLVLTPPPSPTGPTGPNLPPIVVSLPGREDEIESFSFRLSTKLFKRVAVSATYQHSNNQSNQSLFDVSSKQYGFELSYAF